MSDSYSCWGKDWDDWLKAEGQRQEEESLRKEEERELEERQWEFLMEQEREKETMNERCLRCGELLYSETIKRYEGYCANCYSHKKDIDTINELQARVDELQKWREQACEIFATMCERLVPDNSQYRLAQKLLATVNREGGKP